MPQSLDAQFYIIPFLVIATFGLIYTRKAELKPHSRVKLYASVVVLYLMAFLIFGMVYINEKFFGKLSLIIFAIWVLQGFLIPNSWIDKKYYKWKERRQANNELDKSK
ncbi:hypothetical protein [Alkalihalobacillus sp. AL-G]|uniref:hypothetical protein n=1 Tax=Alkalihalobacillus sp. AL-G TaxID=2926399 RepID=UPI00272992CC|nr:hypothetical protein [Alkalihalobacillus sp. AL-G]WLD94055.1 hypothetical protein MOJ78_03915 [Alkalihalobacillus sp. AL-G]